MIVSLQIATEPLSLDSMLDGTQSLKGQLCVKTFASEEMLTCVDGMLYPVICTLKVCGCMPELLLPSEIVDLLLVDGC